MRAFLRFMSTASVAPGTLLPVSPGAFVRTHRIGEGETLTLSAAHEHLVVVAPRGERGTLTVECGIAQQVDVEVILEEDSRVTMVMVTPFSATVATIRQRTQIAAGAHLHLLNVSLSPALTHDCESRVTGDGGVSSIDWIAYAKGSERQELSVRNIFDASRGGGEVTMRAVAEGNATAAVKGMIDIGPRGGGTHTYLTQQVLMLDPASTVDASPALEIKTNDVKASHSASVVRVTPDDLYYFAARGIDPVEARGLLVQGFLGEMAMRMEDDGVRAAVSAAIAEKYAAAQTP